MSKHDLLTVACVSYRGDLKQYTYVDGRDHIVPAPESGSNLPSRVSASWSGLVGWLGRKLPWLRYLYNPRPVSVVPLSPSIQLIL